eukprot:Sspe_Gene.26345::Locus_10866_Transcript_1_1_Confidence_1.000_Length_1299::g.26345::m.26345
MDIVLRLPMDIRNGSGLGKLEPTGQTFPEAPEAVIAGLVLLAILLGLVMWRMCKSPSIPRSAMYTLREVELLSEKLGISEAEYVGCAGVIPVEEKVDGAFLPRPIIEERSERGTIEDEVVTMLQIGSYVKEFLACPHPLVGRKGTTCPFIPTAIRKDTIFMVLVYATPTLHTTEEIKGVVRGYLRQFESLPPRSGASALYRTLIIGFPLMPLSECRKYIDRVQLEMKGEVLRQGLMIGENHLHNNARGLHGEWYPLRTPHPCLALRHMVPGDLVFLTDPKYPIEVRYDFVSSYVKTFDTAEGRKRVGPAERERGHRALAQLEEEMQGAPPSPTSYQES